MNLFDWMEKEENKNNTEDVKSTNISSISQEEHLEDNKLESPLEIKNESHKPNESSNTLELQTGEIQEKSSTVVLTTIKDTKENIPDKKKDGASTKRKIHL